MIVPAPKARCFGPWRALLAALLDGRNAAEKKKREPSMTARTPISAACDQRSCAAIRSRPRSCCSSDHGGEERSPAIEDLANDIARVCAIDVIATRQ
jgi:hypothetical protein